MIGRLITLFSVFIVTIRTLLSIPGCSSITLPIFHCNGGVFSLQIKTMSLMVKFFFWFVHLHFPWNDVRYLTLHRFQKCSVKRWTSYYRFSLLMEVSVKSTSGKFVSGSPIKKCGGVKGCNSFGPDGNWHNDLEFRHVSIWIRTVLNSSKISIVSPMIRLRWYLQDFMPTSQRPPIWGAWGGIKLNVH